MTRKTAPLTPTRAVIEQLTALYPPPPAGPIPVLPDDTPAFDHLSSKSLRQTAQLCSRVTSADAFGWGGRLVHLMAQSDACLEVLTVICSIIMHGDGIPAYARQLLLTSWCSPPKPVSGKPRPIAGGTFLFKVASKAQMLEHSGDIKHAFKSIQRCVAEPGGVQAVVQRLQAELEANANRRYIIIDTDIENAFNSRNRNQILRDVFACKALRHIWRPILFSYGTPAPLLLKHKGNVVHAMSSNEGVRQGCVFGSTAFSASMQPIYETVQNTCHDTLLQAIIDDAFIGGTPTAACAAFRQLGDLYKDNGIRLAGSKCKLLWPYAEALPGCVQGLVDEFKLQVVYDALPILGSVISLAPEAVKSWVSSRVDATKPFFDCFSLPQMSAQLAVKLLRSSGRALLEYVAQTLDPETIRESLDEFDDSVFRTLAGKCGLSADMSALSQAIVRLPVREGGLGLPSIRSRADVLRIGRILQNLPELAKVTSTAPAFNPATGLCHPLSISARKIFQTLRACVPKEFGDHKIFATVDSDNQDTLSVIAGSASFASPGARAAFTQALKLQLILKQTADLALLAVSSPSLQAKLLSRRQRGANGWLQIAPIDSFSSIPDRWFRIIVRDWLNMLPDDTVPGICACGARFAELVGYPGDPSVINDHFKTGCRLLAGFRTRRHDKVKDSIYLQARAAGVALEREARVYVGESSQCRADLFDPGGVTGPNQGVMVGHDVVVASVTRQDILDKTSKCPLAAAREAVKRKRRASNWLTPVYLGVNTLPFALEDTGALDTDALAMLRRLTSFGADLAPASSLPLWLSSWVMLKRLSVVVHVANARLLLEGVRMSKSKAAGVEARQVADSLMERE